MEDLPEWPTGRLLLVAARLVEREWNHVLAGHGLTHAGFLVLHTLAEGPLAQRELAARTYVEEQTIGPVLERLARAGHVSRERDPADRRRIVVTMTSAGAEVYEFLMATDAAESIISVRDLAAFREDLVRIITNIRPTQGM
ncbi:MarR family winged helix-turn-helix transcriptional regulator [Herbidospora cretacea]|uniref:MarR family winged helix-turn-helix transcriptional regulator n=1 Tax=Herbidospora cretacea TaxID=28444 RepID=UPI000773BF1C|nr:MarR family transcriptional regulator [Herbidospora cretacea]